MKKSIIFILICIFSVVSKAANNISSLIDQKILQTDPNLNIGIKITNLDKNKVIFEKNTDRYFVPASSLKFITVISLLEHFGGDYQFTSRVLKKREDYYFDIHDPNFRTEDLESMILDLVKHSGKDIQGNIHIVNDEFSVPSIMRSKTVGDTIYCYGAPITKVHVNKNCSKLIAFPSRIGQQIKVKSDKNFPYIIENKTETLAKNKLDRLHTSIQDDKYVISGTLSKSTGQVVIGAVTNDNFLQVKHYLKKLLDKQNVNLEGKILFSSLPPTGTTEIVSISKSFKDMAAIAIKKTDNFITDYLLAEFATQKNQIEWRRATNSMKYLVSNKFGVDITKTEIKDGSGISRLNMISVNQFSDFLKVVSKKENFSEVKLLMAYPGEEGTLLNRFKDIKKLYAKTGTLSGVSSLVGYFYDKNDELYSFVIFSNNFYGGHNKYRMLEEDIIKLVVEG